MDFVIDVSFILGFICFGILTAIILGVLAFYFTFIKDFDIKEHNS